MFSERPCGSGIPSVWVGHSCPAANPHSAKLLGDLQKAGAQIGIGKRSPAVPATSAGFRCRIRMNCFILSHVFVTCSGSPEVRSTAFLAQPPDLPPVPYGYGLRYHLLPRPAPSTSYPVFVHRLTSLLHASFRPDLAVGALALRYPFTSIRFGKGLSPSSG
jgi:hypothetical protein